MRQIAQLISDLFAQNAVREVTTTIPPPAKTLQSVLTAVKTTFHDPISVKFGWLVGCFGFNGPLRQYSSLYRAVSQREGERGEK